MKEKILERDKRDEVSYRKEEKKRKTKGGHELKRDRELGYERNMAA